MEPLSPSSAASWSVTLASNRRVIAAELLLFLALALSPLPVMVTMPMLAGLAGYSLGVRKVEWKDIGFVRPRRFWVIAAIGLVLACTIQLLDRFALGPFFTRLSGQSADLHVFSPVQGHLFPLLMGLLVSWTIAAFGEEFVFRGYFLSRCKDLMGGGWLSSTVGIIAQAIAFAAVHRYQGWAGALNAGWVGLILGILYVVGRRNLALPVAVHGMADTIGFVTLYLGLG